MNIDFKAETMLNEVLRGESHMGFRTQCVIVTLACVYVCVCVCVCVCVEGGEGGGTINNDVLKFRKVIEFESSCITSCLSYHQWKKIISHLRK